MGLASPAAAAAAVAVAGSERELKLYDRATLQCTRTVAAPAHADRVNEISFAPPRSAAAGLLFSASSDGAVRAWDCGGGGGGGAAPSLELRGGREEVWSVSVSDGPLVAAGTQAALLLWDVRRADTPAARLEVHTEAVSAVRFQPGSATALVSGSVDGLICSIDCRQTNDDDAVTGVINEGRPVSSLGFFGPEPASHLHVLSSLETLSVWDLQQQAGTCLARHDALRREVDMLGEEEAAAGAGDGIDYLVGCQYCPASQRLYLVAGEHCGTLHLLAVEKEGVVALASLRGGGGGAARGHTSDVRCFLWDGGGLLSGGEDARLCSWSPDTDAAAGSDATPLASTSRKSAKPPAARAGGAPARGGSGAPRRANPY